MSKELFVSSTPHETKVAIVEDDQLTEVYFERENEYTLAGSIYKGRVTRVLPGMQSAFVNIGLERDAFLYVSDFLLEEDDEQGTESSEAAPAENGAPQEQEREGARKWRGRRRRGRGGRDGRDRFADRGANDQAAEDRGEREKPAEAASEEHGESR